MMWSLSARTSKNRHHHHSMSAHLLRERVSLPPFSTSYIIASIHRFSISEPNMRHVI
jgi:hypothetical protein